MRESLRALLEGLIDYAGLFPPAKLPLPEALANYLRYRESAEAWMLGRFICPAARLKEIPPDVMIPCAALGRGGDTQEAFLAGLEADLADIAASHLQVEVLEVKLPRSVEYYTSLARAIGKRFSGRAITIFVEPPAMTASEVREVFAGGIGQPFVGFKFRAGGVVASAFPSSEQLAFAWCYGISSERPVKATAGLHHPLPRWDESVKARMHGFVNLFVAGALVHARVMAGKLDEMLVQIRELLDDADPAHFSFKDSGLLWRDVELSTQQIRAARTVVQSFGSCSFDEPRDDLRALGWL